MGKASKARQGSRTSRERVGEEKDQARVTLPALMHEVHTFSRLGVAPTRVRTRWMFGFQRRLVRRWECEMLCPKPGPLPQTSQVAATVHSLG